MADELEKMGYPDLVLSHCELITYLRRKGPRTSIEVAAAIRRDKSTVTTLVRKLEQKNLIFAQPNPSDGRSRILKLSPEGRKLAGNVALKYSALERKIGEVLNESERSALLDLMEKLYLKVMGSEKDQMLQNKRK